MKDSFLSLNDRKESFMASAAVAGAMWLFSQGSRLAGRT
jgi:hypothetical protein